ncbi:MAG: HAMP domain-containing protein, partial [Acidobacteriia bacterium]|nr:HAMP domain-containing protein [Terriglobia bacterium]
MKPPRRLQGFSIRQQLIIGMVIISSLGVAISGAAFFFYEAYSARRDLEREISSIADMVAAHSTAALAFSDARAAAETLEALSLDKRIEGAALATVSGDLLANYGQQLPVGTGGARVEATPAAVVVYRRVNYDNETVGYLALKAGTGEIKARLRRNLELAASVGLLSILVGAFLALKVAAVVAGPITLLAQTADSISRGSDYSLRARKNASDETGVLIDAFNRMVAQ